MATKGMAYDVSPEMLDNPKMLALVHEQAMSDAVALGATQSFRFLVFRCRTGDLTCPNGFSFGPHGHAFWSGVARG